MKLQVSLFEYAYLESLKQMMNCVSCATKYRREIYQRCQNVLFRNFLKKMFLSWYFLSFLFFFLHFICVLKWNVNIMAVVRLHLKQIYRSNCKLSSGKTPRHQYKRICYVFFFYTYILSYENAPILHQCAHKFHLFTEILMVFIFFVHLLFFFKSFIACDTCIRNMGNEISRLVLKSIKTMSILVELIKNFPFHTKKNRTESSTKKSHQKEREKEKNSR